MKVKGPVTLETVLHKYGQWITLGDYTIYNAPCSPLRIKASNFWIQRKDGVGMETSGEKLNKLIGEFFKKEL